MEGKYISFTLSSVGWLLLLMMIISIGIWFTYCYHNDKDKRKLMFAIAFFSSTISYLYLAMGYHTIEPDLLLQNLYVWTSMLVMIAIFIAVNESVFNAKDFGKVFNIFLVFFGFSLLMIVMPFDAKNMLGIVRQVIAVEIIIVSIYMFIKRKALSSLMFLLSLICFTVAGLALARDIEYLSIFSYFMAYIFLTLVFIVLSPSTTEDKKGIGSYFSLKHRLETTTKALQESEEKYKRIVENMSDVVMVTQPDGIISYLSQSSEKVFGYNPEELIGKQPWIIHPDDLEDVKKIHFQALKGESGSTFEYRIKTKSDEIRWVSHSWSPILDNNKLQMIISIVRDVTESKSVKKTLDEKVKELENNDRATLNIMKDLHETVVNLETARQEINNKNEQLEKNAENLKSINQELNVAQEELSVLNQDLEKKVEERTEEIQKLLKQKDDFIGQLGHDLKTPLTPLVTLLPIIRKRVTDEKLIELLDTAIHNTDFMRNLVVKTLQLARLNSPNVIFDIEDANLLESVHRIIENKQIIFKEKNITIDNMIDKEIMVQADTLRLAELFDNLISNAIKYSHTSGGIITIDAKKDSDVVTVSIKDTGIGINSDQISHIFDEFYKADHSRHELESSGLGLSICKRIVEKHGGRIWVESPGLGMGTSFYFTLKTGSKSIKYEAEKMVGG